MVLANHQRIVVGVDGSANSTSAAQWAASMAVRLHSPLHIVSAVHEPVYYAPATPLAIPADVWEQLRHRAEEVVAGLATAIRDEHASLTVTTRVENASAARTLGEHSKTARMLVVGNSGTGMLASSLLGSTAKAVVDKSSCPVVVWRAGSTGADAPVAVGIDGGVTGESAVEFAFEIASARSVRVRAVHIWNAGRFGGGVAFPGFVDWADVEHEEAALLAESLAGWAEKYPDVKVERVLHQGAAASSLVDFSASSQLVVVGSRGRGAIARALVGSTSSNLAYHAHCPVMICRDGQ